MKTLLTGLLTIALTAPALHAIDVQVTITGEVEGNQIGAPPLGDANVGDPVTVSFIVDSDVFQNSPSFPTRGYIIDQPSFSMTLGAASVGLESPFPSGDRPYFVIRDNDPGVDGFFIATSFDFPIGVPLDQVGVFGSFSLDYSVTYPQTALPSLDILDALGTYDFTGLSVFSFEVEDGGFKPLLIVYEQMTIGLVDCPGDADGDGDADIDDIVLVVLNFGNTGAPGIPGDVDLNGVVNIDDIVQVVLNFGGPCA